MSANKLQTLTPQVGEFGVINPCKIGATLP